MNVTLGFLALSSLFLYIFRDINFQNYSYAPISFNFVLYNLSANFNPLK